ncbi:MAG: M61 family metallopeptidase [Spirochaetes bacterium]|nr:M61 family metallopeptidase [Spirochaetota bacterium]
MSSAGLKIFIFIVFIINVLKPLFPVSTVKYQLSFDNRIHHEAEIKIIFNDLPNRPLTLNMSRASPGDYTLFEFSKNVYNIKAHDLNGKRLEIFFLNQDKWQIKKHTGNVIFSYTLFGDHMDGTHSSISSDHIYLNIPSAFIWAEGLEDIPIEVYINNPESNWSIMTQLVPVTKNIYKAPDFNYFIDSPIEITTFTTFEWFVKSGGKTQKIRLAVHHRESPSTINIFQKHVEAIVNECMKIFGELPDFDYGEYTFITNYLPTAKNDGMEHRNSTVITSNRNLRNYMTINLRLIAHEFIHAWNIERIRPGSLESFNLREANISEELWFVEGITSYYQDLVLLRAKIINFNSFLGFIGEKINYVYNFPGNELHSVVEMSRMAVYFNGGVFEDPTNLSNIYISYYSYGAVLGFAMDIMIRSGFKDISLDDFMKKIWQDYGKTNKGYSNDDLEKDLALLTGDSQFAKIFFNKYIYGKELPDLKNPLSNAGIILKKRYPSRASMGRIWILSNRNHGVVVNSYTQKNEPYYQAGIDIRDTILEMDKTAIRYTDDILRVLGRHKPNDKILIKFRKDNGTIKQSIITLEEIKALILISYEVSGVKITEQIRQFRKKWFE